VGNPVGFDGGMCVCGPSTTLTVRDSSVASNRVSATVGTSAAVKGGSGGALEADGDVTIAGTRITGNVVDVRSAGGVALAVAVLDLYTGDRRSPPASVSDSVISGNTVTATSSTGSARVLGVGVANNAPAVLTNVRITGNTGEATAPTGSIYGGGVFNGQVFKDLTPVLTLRSSTISANTIKAGKGTSVEGGGVYTKGFRIVREQSVIRGNKPDQCAGC
jgi:hypothetical protein